MGVKSRSLVSSDRENWDKLFKGMVKMLQTKQGQLESLVNERKILEDRIKLQHLSWSSDVQLYEDHLSQMRSEIDTLEIMRSVEVAKCNVLAGVKDTNAYLCKLKLGHAEDELDDFRAWFNLLTENPNNEHCSSKASDDKVKESEIRRLKLEYEKLASEKNSELSALLRENDFVWFQFKRLESELTDKLKSKDDEVVQANEKISSILLREEQLRSSNQQKDETILSLKAKVAEMEEESSKKDEEISRLKEELVSLKKCRSSSVTPVLLRCGRDKNCNDSNMGVSDMVVKKEQTSARFPVPAKKTEKGSKSLKRKRVTDSTISETPKLFTSSFQPPKLKTQSPQVIQLS